MAKSNKDAKFKAPKITSSPKKSNSSSSTKSKMSPSVKNGLVFGGIAVVLIIVTVIFMMSNGNRGSQKYINNYGDIKTSITLNTTKLEATLNVIIDGKTMSQIGSYKCIDVFIVFTLLYRYNVLIHCLIKNVTFITDSLAGT